MSLSNRRCEACDLTTIVIVNYNGRHFLGECLGALEHQDVPRHCYEVLVIDNASTDDSSEFVRLQFPGVRFVTLERNLGFAGGNNVGFRLARGQWVALLNNDTRVEPGWLSGLLAATGDGVGGVCSRLMFRDEPGVVNSTGLVPYRDGRAGDRHLRRAVDGDVLAPAEVFGGCGASLLLSRELLDDVGGFDRTLFMYYEDFDLAWRARLRGWRFVYAPDSVVHHVCGGSATNARLLRQVERNRVLVALANAPAFPAASAFAGLVLRLGRLVYRFAIARTRYRLTAAHLWAMVAAFASVAIHAPSRLLQRYETRVARRLRPDRVAERFVRPAPQRG